MAARSGWAKVGALVAVAAAMGVAYRAGLFAQLSDPQSLARTLVALGVWGYLAFVVAYAALQPFGVPGTIFVFAAPLIWPWPTAFALSMVGTMAASVIGFSFARFVARDWIAKRIPARFRKYDDALAQNALRTVFLLRLIFWMPQALHAFLGVSRVRWATHFWGSLLGYVPTLLVVSYLGSSILDANGHIDPRVWPIFGAIGGTVLLVFGALRLREHRARKLAATATSGS